MEKRRVFVRVLSFVGVVLGCGGAGAQIPGRIVAPKVLVGATSVVPADMAAVLTGLAARAGVIFAGHVTEILRNDEAGYVDVVFRIDTAVRGCGRNSNYMLREWAGLWTGQQERYRVGARLLMLLAARGPSGMSAPVGGMAGAIPLLAGRTPPLTRGTGVAPADLAAEEAQEEVVDLRWVQAQARRELVGTTESESVQGVGGAGPVRVIWGGPVKPIVPVVRVASTGMSLSAVLALLGSVADAQ